MHVGFLQGVISECFALIRNGYYLLLYCYYFLLLLQKRVLVQVELFILLQVLYKATLLPQLNQLFPVHIYRGFLLFLGLSILLQLFLTCVL